MGRDWFKDGQLDTRALDDLEASIREVTDKTGGLMDLVLQKNFEPGFICGHSRLFFPPDYLKEWGKLYGIGLGPDPVSEALDSDYDTAPPEITPRTRSIDQIMHPLMVTRAQVDFVLLPPGSGIARAVLAEEDTALEKRVAIIRPKQLANKRGQLRVMQAAWLQKGNH